MNVNITTLQADAYFIIENGNSILWSVTESHKMEEIEFSQ